LKKNFVRCKFCKNVVPLWNNSSSTLLGGYVDVVNCPLALELVRKEMDAYLKKNSKTVLMWMPK
jgi:hypothetical protein